MNNLTPEEENLLNEALEDSVNMPTDRIPVNNNKIIVEETTLRFSSALWFEEIQKQTITIAGLGGINSWAALLLARMKPAKITMFDPDRVEMVNMAGQLYHKDSIGNYKVSAIYSTLNVYADYFDIFTYTQPLVPTTYVEPILICGFDNMMARKAAFEAWYNRVSYAENKEDYLLIDGRLNAEEFQIFCIKGDDEYNINKYKTEYLFNDSEVPDAPCSFKQTSFCANMIASYMVNLFVNFCANKCNPVIPRDLPFFTTYCADTMFLKTVN